MIFTKNIVFSLLLIISSSSFALNLTGTAESITNELYDNRSCNELYIEASRLEQDTFINKTTIYNDNKTQLASYAATVFSPAIYYLGFNAIQNYKNQVRSEHALSEIDKVRLRMAEKRCFEKY